MYIDYNQLEKNIDELLNDFFQIDDNIKPEGTE